jgi:hypothetical protein
MIGKLEPSPTPARHCGQNAGHPESNAPGIGTTDEAFRTRIDCHRQVALPRDFIGVCVGDISAHGPGLTPYWRRGDADGM